MICHLFNNQNQTSSSIVNKYWVLFLFLSVLLGTETKTNEIATSVSPKHIHVFGSEKESGLPKSTSSSVDESTTV